jgi:hypothetical protein
MTLIYLKRIKTFLCFLLCVLTALSAAFPLITLAQNKQEGLSLSVTPTLFEMSAKPLQSWNSTVKVINNNPHELTIYANVVNFAPQGETGEGKFIPVLEAATEGTTLAEWITLSKDPIAIPAEESVAIPLTVTVPEDATPGGHFAAILIGTRPLDTKAAFQVRTSQIVTSLFFVRIAGDVIENGTIREFRASKTFVSTPQADFEVRFENKGNVHLQPQGQILITNMWGKERGVIPINHQTHFGNVLPESIRKFEFSWRGEPSFSDIGRYKAELTLAYGDDSRKFLTSTSYFYVVPIKALAIVLGSLVAFVLLISWMIKAYVRRMLSLAGVEPEVYRRTQTKSFRKEGDIRIVKNVSFRSPVESGVLDLKQRLESAHAFFDTLKTLSGFVISYRVFFASLIVLVIAGGLAWRFFAEVTIEQRDYEVVIDNADVDVTLSSEDILYERHTVADTHRADNEITQEYELVLVNSSDTPGVAAALQGKLTALGYFVSDLKSDFTESKARTVIVYDLALQEQALALSKKLGNALLSANPSSENSTAFITIYIGNDYALQ